MERNMKTLQQRIMNSTLSPGGNLVGRLGNTWLRVNLSFPQKYIVFVQRAYMKWRIRSQILRKKQKTFLRRNMQVTARLEKQVILYWEERRKTPHTTVLFTRFHLASWSICNKWLAPKYIAQDALSPLTVCALLQRVTDFNSRLLETDCQIRFSENAYRDLLQQKSFFGSWGIIVWKKNKCQNKSPRKESTSVLTGSPPRQCSVSSADLQILEYFSSSETMNRFGNVGWSSVHMSTTRWNLSII